MSQTTFSFEIFPPNKESAAEKLTETLDELVGLSPDFISVTCTNKNDDLARMTVKLAGYVKTGWMFRALRIFRRRILTSSRFQRF